MNRSWLTDNRVGAGLALLVLAVFLVYLRSFWNEFLWDDQVILVSNTFIRDWKNVKSLFGPGYFIGSGELSYRPLATLSYMAGYGMWGLSRVGFHGMSLLMHLFAGGAVYLFCRTTLNGHRPALWAAALFLFHPINTEPVLQISFNEELLCGIFYLLSLALFIRWTCQQPDKNALLYWGALGAYALALLSKETAVTLPLIILLSAAAFGQRRDRTFWKSQVGYWLITLFYLLIRFVVLRNPKEAGGEYIGGSFWINGFTMLKVFFLYLKQLVWPVHLSPDHFVEMVSSSLSPAVIMGLLGLFVLAAGTVWVFRQDRTLGFFILWIGITLTPVLNFVPFLKENYMADRYLYIPSVGFAAGTSHLVSQRLGSKSFWVMGPLVLLFGVLTFVRVGDWCDPVRFWARAVETDPQSVESYNRLGAAYAQRNQFDLAARQYEKALALNPRSTRALNNMGNILFSRWQYEQAIGLFDQVLALDPNGAVTYANRGSAKKMLGRLNEAVADYQNAIRLKPNASHLRSMLVVAGIVAHLDFDVPFVTPTRTSGR